MSREGAGRMSPGAASDVAGADTGLVPLSDSLAQIPSPRPVVDAGTVLARLRAGAREDGAGS